MFGDWDPYSEYKIRQPTKLEAYQHTGGYRRAIRRFQQHLDQARGDFSGTYTDSEDEGEPEEIPQANSKSPDAEANPMFAPQSTDAPSTSSPLPSAPVAQTADEAFAHRLALSSKKSAPEPAAPDAPVVLSKPSSEPSNPSAVPNPRFAPPPIDRPSASSPPLDSVTVSTPAVVQASRAPTTQTAPEGWADKIRLAQEKAQKIAAARLKPPPPPATPVESGTQVAAPPPPPPSMEPVETQEVVPPPPPPAKPYNPTISAPPVKYSHIISAPPVRYERPPPDEEDVDAGEERPSKKQKTGKKKAEPPKPTKAQLMMEKMGYKKGQGLGKNNDGVTTHLEVKIRKDQGPRQPRDDFDEDGVKVIKSQQVFDITGGLRAQETKDYGPFGEPSNVIVAYGVVDGVNFETDADRDDGGIRQEIGDAFKSRVNCVPMQPRLIFANMR